MNKLPQYIQDSEFLKGVLDVLKPLPTMEIPEWADLYRKLAKSGSNESGVWRTKRTPYLDEPMRMMSPQSRVEEIVVMKGSQGGWSELAINTILYYLALKPCPILLVTESDQKAKGLSIKRLTPAMEQCEELSKKFNKKDTRSVGTKTINGGTLELRGSHTSTTFSSDTYKLIILDEYERFPNNVDKEGSPYILAKARQTTITDKKMIIISTPTLKEPSAIGDLYYNSDQREYHTPCPHCHEYRKDHEDRGMFVMERKHLSYNKGDYSHVAIICPLCGCEIEEYHKTFMLENGVWIPKNPGHWRVGYHWSQMMTPYGWRSWAEIAKEIDESEGVIEREQSVENVIFGLPFEEKLEIITEDEYEKRQELYKATVPNGVRCIVASVDVQKYSLHVNIMGYNRIEECWMIRYLQLDGLTSELVNKNGERTVWDKLDDVINTDWIREDGYAMRIACMCIDSQGYEGTTDTVYKYTRMREGRNILAIRGSNNPKSPIYKRPRRHDKGDCYLGTIGVFEAKKLILHTRLKQPVGEAGSYHFPKNADAGYDIAAFRQITQSQRLETVYKRGFRKQEWVRDHKVRDELLDLCVYGLYAIRHMQIYFGLNWDTLEKKYGDTEERIEPIIAPNQEPEPIAYEPEGKPTGINLKYF